jgi:ATP-binding cassette subfamily C (CFTR/MRP) protein 1
MQNVQNFLALKNFNLNIEKGKFVCIIGDVGSGKSSLISTLIGDLLYLPKEFLEEN